MYRGEDDGPSCSLRFDLRGGVLVAQTVVALAKEFFARRIRAKEKKKDLALKLMGNRFDHRSPAFLEVLNAIPLAFHGDTKVQTALRDFHVAASTEPLVRELVDKALIRLLSTVTESAGCKLTDGEVRQTYTPRGPLEEQETDKMVQALLVKVLSGERMITVLSVPEPGAMKDMIAQIKAGTP
jgi:hypothetical protein